LKCSNGGFEMRPRRSSRSACSPARLALGLQYSTGVQFKIARSCSVESRRMRMAA
jgi:hypothetical protein